jgi:hypothetical protein
MPRILRNSAAQSGRQRHSSADSHARSIVGQISQLVVAMVGTSAVAAEG